MAINIIKDNSIVLDLGCNEGEITEHLAEKKKCKVTGVDNFNISENNKLGKYLVHDLNKNLPEINYEDIDYVMYWVREYFAEMKHTYVTDDYLIHHGAIVEERK